MTIEAVIWDYGGVLVRTEDPAPRAELAKRLGLGVGELASLMFNSSDAIKGMRGELKATHHWTRLGEQLGITGRELHDVFFTGDRLDSKLMDFVRGLRPTYKTALLSNAFDTLRAQLERGRKMADAFDEIVISAEVGLLKPESAIYELTLERLNAEAIRAVFIDDFIENVEGARKVGMRAIHFQSREQALRELDKLLKQDG